MTPDSDENMPPEVAVALRVLRSEKKPSPLRDAAEAVLASYLKNSMADKEPNK